MLGWIKRQFAKCFGLLPAMPPLSLRTRLVLEQLEERQAPSATPLGDLNAGALGSAPSFLNGERWFTEVTFQNGQSVVFFVANTSANGVELWRTDGTPGGTALVRDINQGTGSSSPRFLTNVNGTLFFAADDGQTGFELWRSDGTSNGTTRVADIRQNGSSDPRFLVNVSGTLYFVANDGQNGFELWRSDGTANGTTMVANLNAGAASSNPHWLLNAEGVLFFAADPGGTPPGFQLFRLDPATNNPTAIPNPTPISVLNPNPRLRAPRWLAYFPDLDRLFFVGEERTGTGNFFAFRLWYIDRGATIAPQRVVDVSNPGNDSFFLTPVTDPTTGRNFLFYRDRPTISPVLRVLDAASLAGPVTLATDPFDLYNHNGVLMFSQGGDREPAFVDTRGQSVLTMSATLLANINPTGSSLSRPIYFPTDFVGQPGVWDYLGSQLTWYHWQSTTFFTTLGGGTGTSLGLLYFAANDGTNGIELWKANDTLSAVNMVLTTSGNQIAPGPRSSVPAFLKAAVGSLLFSATGSDPSLGNIGTEPWVEIGPPRILSIVGPNPRTYRMRETLQFTLVMDKPTLVTGVPKLNITLSDSANPALQPQQVQASYFSGSGSTRLIFRYTVQRGQRDLDGIEVTGPLDLTNGSITNVVGDRGDGVFTPSPQPFPTVLVNGIHPWVMQVEGPPVGTYGIGSLLTFRVITSEAVTASPSGPTNQIPPYLNLRIGNVTRQAFLVGGSGTNVLTFRYKVVAGDHAPNGIYLLPSAPLNMGTYTIQAPSVFLRGQPPPDPNWIPTGPRDLDTTIRTPVLFRVFVDTRGPRISSMTIPGLRNYVTGETLEFRFRFDETVYIRSSTSQRPTLRLQIGNVVRHARLVSGHATNTLTFRYTVQASDQDLDGIRILGFSLPSGVQITDAVGNPAVLSFTPPDTRLIRINVPTIRL